VRYRSIRHLYSIGWNIDIWAAGKAIQAGLAYLKRRRPTSNAAAGLFSTQPSGPRPVGCFSALLARPDGSRYEHFARLESTKIGFQSASIQECSETHP
jgi:hypothetical protein